MANDTVHANVKIKEHEIHTKLSNIRYIVNRNSKKVFRDGFLNTLNKHLSENIVYFHLVKVYIKMWNFEISALEHKDDS